MARFHFSRASVITSELGASQFFLACRLGRDGSIGSTQEQLYSAPKHVDVWGKRVEWGLISGWPVSIGRTIIAMVMSWTETPNGFPYRSWRMLAAQWHRPVVEEYLN